MQVIALRTLKQFWERYPQAEAPIRTWYRSAAAGRWRGPADVKRSFGTTVDFISDNRLIFDLGGNKYRLVVHASYQFGRILISSSEHTLSTTRSIRVRCHGAA